MAARVLQSLWWNNASGEAMVAVWILDGGSVLVVSVDIEILGGGSVWLDTGWWICVAGYWMVDLCWLCRWI